MEWKHFWWREIWGASVPLLAIEDWVDFPRQAPYKTK